VACGRVSTDVTADGIREQVDAVLAEPDNPDAWGVAAGMLSAQFEDQEIVGPYYETIESLPAEHRTRLLIMGARHQDWMWHSWALAQLLELEPADDRQRQQLVDVFASAADAFKTSGSFPDDDIGAHVLGCRGWARLTGNERDTSPGSHGGGLAWVLLDALI